jgi:hypothetical protein
MIGCKDHDRTDGHLCACAALPELWHLLAQNVALLHSQEGALKQWELHVVKANEAIIRWLLEAEVTK